MSFKWCVSDLGLWQDQPSVLSEDTGLSDRGVTANVFFQNPDVAKAKLISRMAKMGQPMLPFLAGTAGSQLDSSDSEIEVR